jgi:alpha-tubulin suppressor-like RCC1 family protein
MSQRHRLLVVSLLTAFAASCSATGPKSSGMSGTAVHIVKVSGDSQSATYQMPLAKPLVVKLTDSAGNPVSGAATAWIIDLDGAAQTQQITSSGANGETQITPTMGGVPGTYSITAAINGQSVVFSGISNITLASGLKSLGSNLFANCGVATNGAGFCWGNNFGGQLGNAAATGPHTGPMPVSGGYTFSQISVGDFMTCGLATTGLVYCWGDPLNGVFGNGTAPGGSTVMTPIQAASGRTFSQISVGSSPCGISSGVTYCWGHNGVGELGTGDTVSHWSPVAVSVPSGVSFATVVSGGNSSCGLTPAGAAYCWGDNYNGSLGVGSGSTAYSLLPVPVVGGHVFAALSASTTGMCGLTTAGKAYCWGSGVSGNGTSGKEYAPTAVNQGGLAFTQISANGQHACALTGGGAAYCWGDNYEGDLGSGSFSTSGAAGPVAVTGGLVFTTIMAGGLSTCGYTTSNVMYCWGTNTVQQLGLPPTADTAYAAPVAVPGMSGS